MNYSTMDQETVNFISFMNNMKESHLSLSGSCFSLPEHLIAQAADETLPSEAKAAVDDMHVQTSEFVSNQEFVLKTATDAYTDSKDLENFKAEMRKQKEEAKKISKLIKDNLKKVQASIQGDAVRVSAKSKDDLQAAMQLIKSEDWPMALQFNNYR